MPASAGVGATLNKDKKSAWSGEIVGTAIELTKAWNDGSSERNVYFDMKYYNGSSWVKDKCAANLDPNESINASVSSNKKAAQMSWGLQVNTWNCWYSGCYAHGNIEIK